MGACWVLLARAEQGKERQKSLSHGKQMLNNATAWARWSSSVPAGSPWLKQRAKVSSRHRAPLGRRKSQARPSGETVSLKVIRIFTPAKSQDQRDVRAWFGFVRVVQDTISRVAALCWLASAAPWGWPGSRALPPRPLQPRSAYLGETVCMTWLLYTNLGRGWGCCGMGWATQFPVLRSERILGPREDGSPGRRASVPPAYQARPLASP